MKKIKKKKCRHCRWLFEPDHRNWKKQNYCRKTPCKKASKKASQKKWLSKPENEDYFRSSDNVERVQKWREDTPEYWKRSKRSITLQELLTLQDTENKENIDQNDAQPQKHALQDFLMAQSPVIIGLIYNLTGSALQEDIANTLLRMQQFGQEILFPETQNKGGVHDCKKSNFKTKSPEDTQQLQLDRSPAG
ncbi:MAG: hypothetical protein HN978_21800 [Desulfobacula sp.]|jgi:hypothetical protein|uniref:hypothetical protein n=1 Tax=Desulfobacula sp. TaxID=2593537 RepID=UPI001DCDBD2D|nr:hypothetical protein [Desulfobacula sp.]MBT7052278.1 hypothetical protein [Desulfobacula sp.]MBT7795148.1 hypothetical protein [Desulfobacula sp.]